MGHQYPDSRWRAGAHAPGAAEMHGTKTCRVGVAERCTLGCTRWVISINTADGELALKRLGRTLYEAACMFYLDDACRRLAVHQERRNPAPQTSSKVAFKVCLRTQTCFLRSWHMTCSSISACRQLKQNSS